MSKEEQKRKKLHQSAASLGRRIQELAGVQGLHDAITEHVLTIASLRAANQKLRDKLFIARMDASEARELANSYEDQAHAWKTAHQQLASALAKGKA